MNPFEEAVFADERGTVLQLEVSPGSKQDRFPAGYDEWRHAIRCEIRSQPIMGKANKALIRYIASVLEIKSSRVSIISGSASSMKRILIEGAQKTEIVAKLNLLFTSS